VVECEGCIDEGDEGEEQWREPDDEDGLDRNVDRCLAASVFKDIVAMPLNNVVYEANVRNRNQESSYLTTYAEP